MKPYDFLEDSSTSESVDLFPFKVMNQIVNFGNKLDSIVLIKLKHFPRKLHHENISLFSILLFPKCIFYNYKSEKIYN
jgi:hypothetical protein